MAKHISGINDAVVQSFPGVYITQLQQLIKHKQARINYKLSTINTLSQ